MTALLTRTHAGPLFARTSEGGQAGHAPLVLVHGLLVSSRYMVPLAEALAPYHDVYVPDLPGWGHSADPARTLDLGELADALAAFMYREGLTSAALIANSFGCQIVVELALRRPDLAERLVLVGPTVDPRARTAAQQALRLVATALRERPSLNLVMARDLLDFGVPRLMGTLRVMLEDRIEVKLPRLGVETLVVRGEHDAIVPRRWAREAADLLPRGRLVEVPRAAHALNYSAAGALARIVRTFLGEQGLASVPAA